MSGLRESAEKMEVAAVDVAEVDVADAEELMVEGDISSPACSLRAFSCVGLGVEAKASSAQGGQPAVLMAKLYGTS